MGNKSDKAAGPSTKQSSHPTLPPSPPPKWGYPTEPLPPLPVELWVEIIDYLTLPELATCMRVCHQWNDVASSDATWRRRAVQQWEEAEVEEPPTEGWKKHYLVLEEKYGFQWAVFTAGNKSENASLSSTHGGVKASPNGRRLTAVSDSIICQTKQPLKLSNPTIHLFRMKVHELGSLVIIGFADGTFGDKQGATIYTKQNNGTAWYSSGNIYSCDGASHRDLKMVKGDVVDAVFNGKTKEIAFFRDGKVAGGVLSCQSIDKDMYFTCMLFKEASFELVEHKILDTMPFDL